MVAWRPLSIDSNDEKTLLNGPQLTLLKFEQKNTIFSSTDIRRLFMEATFDFMAQPPDCWCGSPFSTLMYAAYIIGLHM